VVEGSQGSGMSRTGGTGVVCILIFREGVRHHELGRFGMWGRLGGLWFSKRGGGRVRGVQRGALLEMGGYCPPILMWNQILA
jgi:hypothetical protein